MTKERRPHIGIYGRRNNGKSTFINILTNQDIAIVSDIAGTTTDPVKKAYEITGFGAVTLIDTAGIDDTGELGVKRVEKSLASIKLIDLAILVITNNEHGAFEEQLIAEFKKLDTPFILLHSKSDINPLTNECKDLYKSKGASEVISYSSKAPNIDQILHTIRKAIPDSAYTTPSFIQTFNHIIFHKVTLFFTHIDLYNHHQQCCTSNCNAGFLRNTKNNTTSSNS